MMRRLIVLTFVFCGFSCEMSEPQGCMPVMRVPEARN